MVGDNGKLETTLRKLKIDSLLKNISNKISNYKTKELINEMYEKIAYMTGGPFKEKPTNLKKDFYLILDLIVPKKYFLWAEKEK